MKLFFRKSGSGPPLVILHGLYGSSDNWLTIARLVSERYTVILPDLRNHGQSPHNQVNTYEAMADDVDELADHLQLNRFILAGHSMGGKVAMKYAMTRPEKLNGLAVFDISPFGSRDEKNSFFNEHSKILNALISADLSHQSREEVDRSLSDSIKSERTRSFLMKNLRRTDNGKFMWKINAESLLAGLPDIMDGIASVNNIPYPVTGFPVVFAKGSDSDYLRESDFDSVSRIFPAAEFITIEKAGHWIHVDRPDAVTGILMNLA